MKRIQLTQGKFALVDDKDFKELSKRKWYAHETGNTFYALRSIWDGKKQFRISMHRQLLGLSFGDGKIADHRNRNGLDNRRANLRVVSKSKNGRNRKLQVNSTSGHPGVCWYKPTKKWRAYIGLNGSPIWLGLYDNILDAVEARKKGEAKYWNNH